MVTSTCQIKPSVLAELSGRGARIVARFHSAEPVSTRSAASGATPVTLTGASWVQRPGEVDIIGGLATVKLPSAATNCTSATGGEAGRVRIALALDGQPLAGGNASAADTPALVTVNLLGSAGRRRPSEPQPNERWLFEPPHRERHVLTATATDTCGENGGVAIEHFRIESISLDVIGIR